MQSVKEWFDKAYVIATSGFGKNMTIEYVQSGKYQGEYKIIDTKTEHVVGLRNILDDIGKIYLCDVFYLINLILILISS